MFLSFYLLLSTLTGLAFGQTCPQGQLYPNTNDRTCKTYYECYNNNYLTNNCGDGQIFYPGMNQCVLQSSYDCVCDAPGCVRPNCTGTENTDIADKNTCNNYIYCNGRYPLRRQCPSGYLFNPDSRTCESRSTTRYQCPSDPFQCPQANGNYADLRDPNCQIYYYCNNWQGTKQVCQSNFRYYQKLDRCVLPDSYDCHEQNPFECPGQNQDYPDPKDRSRYYYCMGDAPLHRTCDAGLYFSANNRRCE